MKVFISYSVGDRELVQRVADEIRPYAEPLYWGQNQEPGEDAWKSIFRWIMSADCVIAIITDSVVARGAAVNQEIGFAAGHNKLVIPMVASGIGHDDLGCLHGITYVKFKHEELGTAVEAIKKRLLEKKKKDQAALVVFGIVVVALMALSNH